MWKKGAEELIETLTDLAEELHHLVDRLNDAIEEGDYAAYLEIIKVIQDKE